MPKKMIKGYFQIYFIWKAHQDPVQSGVVNVFTPFNSSKFGLRKAWTKLLFVEAVPNLVCLQAFQCCAQRACARGAKFTCHCVIWQLKVNQVKYMR